MNELQNQNTEYKDMNQKKIIVCIPTYNEKDNIEKLLTSIFNLKIQGLSVLIVDDSSPDGTGELVDRLAISYPIQVIHRTKKDGLGGAYITGFKRALEDKADFIISMDADLSHNPNDIPRLLNEMKNGYDLVIGSRKIAGGEIKNWSAWRHFCSNGATWISKILLNLKTNDITNSYRCYTANTLTELNMDEIKSNGYAFFEEIVYLCEKKKFKIKEIPITFIDRELGESKLSRKEIIDFFITIFKLRFKK